MVEKKLFRRDKDYDVLLKELCKFRQSFPKDLVAYYPYPCIKEALMKNDIAIWRNSDGDIVGFYWIKNLKTKRLSRLEEIYSKERGLGSTMIEDAMRCCTYEEFVLYVLKTNENAIKFYKKHGLAVTGEKKNMYLMHKKINKEQLGLW